MQPFLF